MEFELNFFLVAAFAVTLSGISKSGFVGGGSMIAVPLMALFVSPQTAAGIMLPILVAMDFLNLWRYRKDWSKKWFLLLFPAAIVGIGLGTLGFQYFSAAGLKVFIGLLALFFVMRYLVGLSGNIVSKPLSLFWGRVLGALGGLTSFIAHAGGPPIDSFMLSQRLDKTTMVATNVYLFTLINLTKLVPYFFLGLLSPDNLSTSLILLPFVPVGVFVGHFLHNKVPQRVFEQIAYVLLAATGSKLVWDGLSVLL